MDTRYSQDGKNTADVLLDQPMYSRLFVSYNKSCLSEDVMRREFSKFGPIEDIKIPYDDKGVSKGICFIKFVKTSDAARALEGMHKKTLPGSNRIVKVSVAVNPSEVDTNPYDDEKYRRIFIQVSKNVTEKELEDEFASFGHIMSVFIPRDRITGKHSPWAYITFAKFSEAANAVEQCPRHYRAIFAKPKNLKPETSLNDDFLPTVPVHNNREYSITSMLGNKIEGFVKVNFICPFELSEHQVRRLFDIVPGMTDFHVFPDYAQNCVKGIVTYSNPNSAAHAVERLHDFPFAPGLSILVRGDQYSTMQNKNSARNREIKSNMPEVVANLKNALLSSTSTGAPDLAQLSEAVVEANKLLKLALNVPGENEIDESNLNYCSVKLPPVQPLAHIDSPLAKRCFIICKPAPPPIVALRDIFCRFGDLITVYALPNKTVGYAQFASVKSADEAMKTLHGAVICGVRIKVLEADEEAPPKRRRTDY